MAPNAWQGSAETASAKGKCLRGRWAGKFCSTPIFEYTRRTCPDDHRPKGHGVAEEL